MNRQPLAWAIAMSLCFTVNLALFDVYAHVALVMLQTAAIVLSAFAAAVHWIHVAASIVARRH